MSLGSKLKKTIEANEAAALAKEEAKRLSAERKRREHQEKVNGFFKRAKETITNKITTGLEVDGIRVPDYMYIWNTSLDNLIHPDYATWSMFCTWAHANELDVDVEDCHDGMGLDAWQVIKVYPLND